MTDEMVEYDTSELTEDDMVMANNALVDRNRELQAELKVAWGRVSKAEATMAENATEFIRMRDALAQAETRLDAVRRLAEQWKALTPEDHTLADEPHGDIMAYTGKSLAIQLILVLDGKAAVVEGQLPSGCTCGNPNCTFPPDTTD